MKTVKNRKKSEAGFTLVEIAIVMVIIGLLVGGVLKGTAMIENAKTKSLIKDIEGLRIATITFLDRYGMYPGDENSAEAPSGDTNVGDNDGYFDEDDGFAIEDLRCAGLIGKMTNIRDLPKNSFGGTIRIDWYNPQAGAGNFIVCTNIPFEICQEIDTKYDDGDHSTGDIQGDNAYDAERETLCWRL